MKVHANDKEGARKFLEVFPAHLSDEALGTIGEVFDAREPHTAGGCVAQAWSVAEVLRSWIKTA
jgi:glycogen debranching enzyme